MEWPHFPRLVARLLAVQAVRKHYVDEADLYSDKAFVDLDKALSKVTEVVQPRVNGEVPALQQYLQEVWDLFCRNYGPLLDVSSVRELRTTLEEYFRFELCQNCGLPNTCNQEMAGEPGIVESNCLLSLGEIYQSASSLADTLYRDYAKIRSDSRHSFVFSTGHTDELIGGLNSAVTGFAADLPPLADGKQRRQVGLTIAASYFALDDYFACLYVIFHECFVHGWCGVAVPSNAQCLSESFHDGWIDWVGVSLLCRCLESIDCSHSQVPAIAPHQVYFSSKAQDLSKLRGNARAHGANLAQRQVASGASAARKLFDAFALVFDDRSIAEDLFYRFSLALNASTYSDQARGELVCRLNKQLAGNHGAKRAITDSATYNAIKSFKSDHNHIQLAEALCHL